MRVIDCTNWGNWTDDGGIIKIQTFRYSLALKNHIENWSHYKIVIIVVVIIIITMKHLCKIEYNVAKLFYNRNDVQNDDPEILSFNINYINYVRI